MPREARLNRIRVVAGILEDDAGRVLIAERIDDGPLHGLWEFPGGKIRAKEAPEAALCRELAEELGIAPVTVEFFLDLKHDYPDRRVSIRFYRVTEWHNEPSGLEGQALKWVEKEHLKAEPLLPADLPVVEALAAG